MSASSIFVVGPEGSGTTLLWRCIIAHPELQGMNAMQAPAAGNAIPATNTILHLSLPTLRPMRWVQPEDLPAAAKVILLRRSPVHTVYSAYLVSRRADRAPDGTLDVDFEPIRARIGDSGGPLPHHNSSSHKPYREYYTRELQDIVFERFRDDFEYFGYDYDL